MSGRVVTTFPAQPVGEVVGVQDTALVASPGAGNEWLYTVPSGYFRRLVTGYALLTTSAAVANRFVGLRATDGTRSVGLVRFGAAVTASLAMEIQLAAGTLSFTGATAALAMALSLPTQWLPPGYTIGSSTLNLQAGDAYTSIALVFDCVDFGLYGVAERVHPATRDERDQMTSEGYAPLHAATVRPMRTGGR